MMLDFLTLTDDEPEPEERELPDTLFCECGQWKESGYERCEDCDSQHGEPTDD